VTRTGRIDETHGPGLAIAVTVDGWAVRRLIAAMPQIPWAVKAGTRQAHAPPWTRELGPQARAKLAGHARLPTVVVESGVWNGPDRGGRDHHGWDVRGRPKRPWR
jgi:hypothetical protein